MSWLKNLRLKSSDPEVRSRAVETLDGSGKSPDTDRIFASMLDESPRVRCAAIRALQRDHNNESVHSLIGALCDVSCQVRQSAALALGQLGNVIAIEPLVGCLRDPDPTVRTAAAHALEALAWMPVTEEQLNIFEIALGRTATVASPDSDPFLSEPMSGPTMDGSESESYGAGGAGDDSGNLRLFLAGLADNNPAIRISALHALARVPGEKITSRILHLFSDRDQHVRLAAIRVLAERDDPAPAFFLGLLDDTNPQIRLAAIRFLGRVHHPQIVNQLLPLLGDLDPSIREATAVALGEIGNASALESLVLSLIDDHPGVRQAAEQSLTNIDPNWLCSGAAQNARLHIEATFSVCPPQSHSTILQVLSKLPASANGMTV